MRANPVCCLHVFTLNIYALPVPIDVNTSKDLNPRIARWALELQILMQNPSPVVFLLYLVIYFTKNIISGMSLKQN